MSEEKIRQQELERIKEKIKERKVLNSRDAFLLFMQKEVGVKLTPEQKDKFLAYVQERFDLCQCCVLYGCNERVQRMLKAIGLPLDFFGTKEFIINPDFSTRYSPDYKRKPITPVKPTYDALI